MLSLLTFSALADHHLHTALQTLSQIPGDVNPPRVQDSNTAFSLNESVSMSGPASHGEAHIDVRIGTSHLSVDAACSAPRFEANQFDVTTSDDKWQATFRIDSPGLEGTLGTLRCSMRFDGGLTAVGSGDGFAAANYEVYLLNSASTQTQYNGDLNSNVGFSGTQPSDIARFEADSRFFFGQEFDLTGSTSAGVLSRVTAGAEGGSAHGAASAALSLVSFNVLNDQNQPVPFTAESEIGFARGDILAPGNSFAGLSLLNGAPGSLDSTVSLRDGVASAIRDVLENFVAPPHDVAVASDVVNVSGTDADPVTIQLSYDPAVAQALFGREEFMRLVWLNPVTQEWLNAVSGNAGGAARFIKRAYNPATDFQLGNFGLDTVAHVVWAVVNHNSEFAVAHVEPSPLYLTGVTSPVAGHHVLQGFGVPLKTYTVQATSDLSEPFSDLGPVTAAANGSLQFDDADSDTQRFYRIKGS